MKLKLLNICLGILFFSANSYSQFYSRTHIDSLENVLIEQKGKERINTLLILGNTYVAFQLDTASKYISLAREEALEMDYDWGVCKSYYMETDVQYNMSKKNLAELISILDQCSNWFLNNDFEVDALLCETTKTKYLSKHHGFKIAIMHAEKTLEKAKKLNDTKLLSKVWKDLESCNNSIINRKLYLGISDSISYYLKLNSDTMGIFLEKYNNLFHDNSGRIPKQEMIEFDLVAERWGNVGLMIISTVYKSYNFATSGLIDSTIFYTNKMLILNERLGNETIQEQKDRLLAICYEVSGEFEMAIELYKKTIVYNRKIKNNLRLAQSIYKIGDLYNRKSDFNKAIEFFVESLEYLKIIEDDYLLNSVKRNLAGLYVLTGEDVKAEKLYIEAIEWVTNKGDDRIYKIMAGNAYNHLGYLYQHQKKYDKALINYNLACSYLETMSNRIMSPKSNLLSLFIEKKDRIKADSLYIEISRSNGARHYLNKPNYLLQKGKLMNLSSEYKEGVSAFKRFLELSEAIHISEEKREVHFELYKSYKGLGQYEKALSAYTTYKTIEDSLNKNVAFDNVVKKQSEYEISLKEAEILVLEQKQELSDLKLIQQNNQLQLNQLYIVILGSIAFLIAIISYFFFRRYRYKKENEKIKMKAKRTELELQNIQSRQRVELAEVKNNIFANVSHEFRTPLTLIQVPIKNHLTSASEKDKPIFEGVLKNTDHLLKMVDELLDLAKMEAGTIDLLMNAFDLQKFFVHIQANFNPLFSSKNINFSLENKLGNKLFEGDENRLKILVNNLLKNAYNHTEKEDEVICTVGYLEDENNEGIRIVVSNTGEIIDEKDLPYIFDRHYRGDEKKYSGNGIGLSLSKQIVEMHGGKIRAINGLNRVSFEVILPGKLVEKRKTIIIKEKPIILPAEHESYTSMSGEKEDKPTILVVEDNVEMRDLLKGVLINDFDLLFAQDGEYGEKEAINKQPDLVLSDIMMPNMDGFELLLALKNNFTTSHIPIVLLTAKADVESKISGLNQNADDYIGKPFDTNELIARIHNLLRQRKQLHILYSENPLLYSRKIKAMPIDSQFINQMREILEYNYTDGDFTIVNLCSELALNRNSVHNKIKALTSQTTAEYIKNFRLEKAVKLLLETNMTISNIYFEVGFNSPQAFNKVFKKKFNMTPTHFRNSSLEA